MKLNTFELLLRSERKARGYFSKLVHESGTLFCIRCNNKVLYRLKKNLYRCKECRSDFHEFSHRWINKVKISCTQWLWIIKLFELEIPAYKMSHQLSLSYPTVLKSLNTIRFAILCHYPPFLSIYKETLFVRTSRDFSSEEPGGATAVDSRMPILGMVKRDDVFHIVPAHDITIDTLHQKNIRKFRYGNIFYTDRYGDFEALIITGNDMMSDKNTLGSRSDKIGVKSLDFFWYQAHAHHNRYHGIARKNSLLYFLEFVFRYNNKSNHNLFALITRYITYLSKFGVFFFIIHKSCFTIIHLFKK